MSGSVIICNEWQVLDRKCTGNELGAKSNCPTPAAHHHAAPHPARTCRYAASRMSQPFRISHLKVDTKVNGLGRTGPPAPELP